MPSQPTPPQKQPAITPDLIMQILAHPSFRALLGMADPYLTASRAVGDVTNPLSALTDAASVMTGNNAMDRINATIPRARQMTGRVNPEPGYPGAGPDYYRGAGNVFGGLMGAAQSGVLGTLLKHGVLGLPEEATDNPLVSVSTAGAPIMGGSISSGQALARFHGGRGK